MLKKYVDFLAFLCKYKENANLTTIIIQYLLQLNQKLSIKKRTIKALFLLFFALFYKQLLNNIAIIKNKVSCKSDTFAGGILPLLIIL